MADVGGDYSGIVCWPPRLVSNGGVSTLNLVSGRHPGYFSNVASQDGHAKAMHLDTTGIPDTYKRQKLGNLLGPGVTKPTDIEANYYFVLVKKTSNYAF